MANVACWQLLVRVQAVTEQKQLLSKKVTDLVKSASMSSKVDNLSLHADSFEFARCAFNAAKP